MADVPEELLEQIKQLEKIFTVEKEKLKEVTDHFVKELAKGETLVDPFSELPDANFLPGLSTEGGSIVSL